MKLIKIWWRDSLAQALWLDLTPFGRAVFYIPGLVAVYILVLLLVVAEPLIKARNGRGV